MVVFDLDGTLAESKQPMDSEMSELLCELLKQYRVAIISGASYAQFERQFLVSLDCAEDELSNLVLVPTNGATMYEFDGEDWTCRYARVLMDEQKQEVRSAFERAFEDAPLDKKEVWDPDREKRRSMVAVMEPLLSDDFEVSIGGTTSIDVTQKGIDKAFGIRKLCEEFDVSEDEVLFVGDSLEDGGNDAAAKETDAETRSVDTIADTKAIIRELTS